MSCKNKILGQSGENMAALFFEQKGYVVEERNWRCKAGEIDLIIRKASEWRFVEVKTRSSDKFGLPEEALTAVKRAHFRQAIEWYMAKNRAKITDFHADVVSVIINNREFEVKWLPDCM